MKIYDDSENDASAREAALNTAHSFIVQAPAGSGKTELLIQRYLALLPTVSHPEEILAITFTRKAAREIQNRVIEALLASFSQCPKEPYKAKTYWLAKEAVQHGDRLGWSLLENPNQMRLFTIDALSRGIVLQMPRASGLGGYFQPSDDASALYQKTALELLLTLEENEPWQESLKTLLSHLHNKWATAIDLIAELLGRRDQWLPHVMWGKEPINSQLILEQDLKRVIEYTLQKANEELTPQDKKELAPFLQLSPHQFDKEINKSILLWKAISHFLLTEKGTWRKKAVVQDKKDKILLKEMKGRFEIFLRNFVHREEFRELLFTIRLLPDAQYPNPTFRVLKALMQLLPVAVGLLKLQFKDTGLVDFIEVGDAARKALGEPDAPSPLTLKLDYKISHLLIDEFQDTSFSQIRLLEKIIGGWEAKDNRTIFLVGDPMQSIYRFRQAEVGIFLKVQKSKQFFHLPLESLCLHTNYRSSTQIVHWANQTFTDIFPKQENSPLGAVAYSRSVSHEVLVCNKNRGGVFFHPIVAESGPQEALQIAMLAHTLKNSNPNESIAILVRARQHLAWILKALRVKGLPYLAPDIENAFSQPVIQDLLTLLRALLSLDDKVAWLSMLRSPYCGLMLDDLCVIAQKHTTPVFESMQNKDILNQLSQDGRERINGLLSILRFAFSKRYREPLPLFLKNTWQAVGGPASIREKRDLDYAKFFFDVLEKEVGRAHFVEVGLFQQKLSKLFIPTFSDAQNPIQLMTIHRAKGLEFDHVILPGLERRGAVDEKQLLLWLEHPTKEGTALLMSPLEGTLEEADPLYQFLRYQMRQKANFELIRLLYVAATRAKKNLHLFASNAENNWEKATKGSFLELLIPALPHTQVVNAYPVDPSLAHLCQTKEKIVIHRTSQQTLLELSRSLLEEPIGTFANNAIILNQEAVSKAIGTLLHRILRLLAATSSKEWCQINWESYRKSWQNALLRLGVPPQDAPIALEQVYFGLQNVLTCRKAAWILDPHLEAYSEYPITGLIDGELVEGIIDRTFLDKQGFRWVVDYKTAKPDTETLEAFYQFQKNLHEPQLTRYAKLLKLKSKEPIRLGLYFPFIKGWCEWGFS